MGFVIISVGYTHLDQSAIKTTFSLLHFYSNITVVSIVCCCVVNESVSVVDVLSLIVNVALSVLSVSSVQKHEHWTCVCACRFVCVCQSC